MQVTEIQTDHTLMALDLSSTPEYPIRFYLDIMDQFDRAGFIGIGTRSWSSTSSPGGP